MATEMHTCFLVTLIIINHLFWSFSTHLSLFDGFTTVSFFSIYRANRSDKNDFSTHQVRVGVPLFFNLCYNRAWTPSALSIEFIFFIFNEYSIKRGMTYFLHVAIYDKTFLNLITKYSEPLNRGHLWVFKNLSNINRCPLLGCSLTKTVTFGTKHFIHYSRHARYLGCPLLGGFTVLESIWKKLSKQTLTKLNSEPNSEIFKFVLCKPIPNSLPCFFHKNLLKGQSV